MVYMFILVNSLLAGLLEDLNVVDLIDPCPCRRLVAIQQNFKRPAQNGLRYGII